MISSTLLPPPVLSVLSVLTRWMLSLVLVGSLVVAHVPLAVCFPKWKTYRFYVYQPVSPWTSTFAKDQDLLHVPLAMMTTHRRGPRLVRVGSQ